MALFPELDQPSKDLVTAVEEKAVALFDAMDKHPHNAQNVNSAREALKSAPWQK